MTYRSKEEFQMRWKDEYSFYVDNICRMCAYGSRNYRYDDDLLRWKDDSDKECKNTEDLL